MGRDAPAIQDQDVQEEVMIPDRYHGVPGHLKMVEAEYLYQVPKRLGHGDYIDLGTYKGRSACMLAAGIIEHDVGGRVFTVDKFDAKTMTSGRGRDTYDAAVSAFGERDLLGTINLINADTAEVALRFDRVNFVFVDADHAYEGVLRDFLAWSPIADELAFHDSDTEGVAKLLKKLPSFGWEKQGEVHTLTWWTKCIKTTG